MNYAQKFDFKLSLNTYISISQQPNVSNDNSYIAGKRANGIQYPFNI